MEALLSQLKEKIIETLDLIDIKPEDIKEDEQLVGGELNIDSIDLLELVMMLEKDYDLKIESKEMGKEVFSTLRTLAEFIEKNRKEPSID